VGFALAFALQVRKKHGKTSVRVAIHKHTIRISQKTTVGKYGPPNRNTTFKRNLENIFQFFNFNFNRTILSDK